MSNLKIKDTPNKKPAKLSKGKDAVKTHNSGKVTKPKAVKPMNIKKNYGVKDSK